MLNANGTPRGSFLLYFFNVQRTVIYETVSSFMHSFRHIVGEMACDTNSARSTIRQRFAFVSNLMDLFLQTSLILTNVFFLLHLVAVVVHVSYRANVRVQSVFFFFRSLFVLNSTNIFSYWNIFIYNCTLIYVNNVCWFCMSQFVLLNRYNGIVVFFIIDCSQLYTSLSIYPVSNIRIQFELFQIDQMWWADFALSNANLNKYLVFFLFWLDQSIGEYFILAVLCQDLNLERHFKQS